jgi:hypothetical protein
MVDPKPLNNRRNALESQGGYYPRIDPSEDDLLLTRLEIMEAWEITDWQIRRLVKDGKLRRVRRPNYQPYYPLSQVELILGPPKTPPTPAYRQGFDLEEAAA